MPRARSKVASISGLDGGLLIMRIGFMALLLVLHGWPRLGRAYDYAVLGEPWGFIGVVAALGFPLPAVFAVASTLAESVGALLLGVGLFARTAALLVAANMAVATWNELSGGDPLELPALYLVVALGFVVAGAGAYSVDGVRRR